MEKWTLAIAAEIENAPDPEALMALLREYADKMREELEKNKSLC